jgi:hypothetical protein
MAKVMKEDDETEEMVIVEDESELDQDDDDDQDDGDERVEQSSNDGNDDEREAIRERRRKEKLDRKDRRDNAIKRDKVELDFLRKRNDDLERRVSAQEQRAHRGDLSALDQAIANAQQEANMAERVIAKAVAAGNGDDVTQAMRYRDQALARANQLAAQKQQAARPVAQNQIDDRTLQLAKEFMQDNPWYDAQGRDEDSAIVIAIDQAMAKDGFDPRSEDYWDELRKRAARRLPDRFGETGKAPAKDQRTPRGGPTVGSGREHAPTSTRKEIYISPERKQALVDAGVWEDPVLRQKYVKRYAEYDRQKKT